MGLSRELSKHKEILSEIGRYIHDCRVRRKLSLQHLSVRLGVNPSYLREIELGERLPGDEFIRSLSENCELDENYIFNSLGKVPLIAREELERQSLLQEILKEIGMSKLSEEQKKEIYRQFYLLAKNTLSTLEGLEVKPDRQ